jgi:hypothetical protein
MACRCVEHEHIHYAGRSMDECADAEFTCPENTERVGDTCGCGCAQNPACPAELDCQATDCEASTLQCPLSTVKG